jgi:hypothetical protein
MCKLLKGQVIDSYMWLAAHDPSFLREFHVASPPDPVDALRRRWDKFPKMRKAVEQLAIPALGKERGE